MQTTAFTLAFTTAQEHAIANLKLALRRYERIAQMPRRLQIPLCGDLLSLERAEQRARERGHEDRALELADWRRREEERRAEERLWSTGQRRRSRRAWAAIAARLGRAIEECTHLAALEGGPLSFARSRLVEAQLESRG